MPELFITYELPEGRPPVFYKPTVSDKRDAVHSALSSLNPNVGLICIRVNADDLKKGVRALNEIRTPRVGGEVVMDLQAGEVQ